MIFITKPLLTHMPNWKLRLETDIFLKNSSFDHENQLPGTEQNNMEGGTVMINFFKTIF